MKIIIPTPALSITKATSGAGAGGLTASRRLGMRPAGCYIATKGTGSYSINAATFATAFGDVLNNGTAYSFSSNNAAIVRAYTTRDFKCLWAEISEGVLLNDYSGAVPASLDVDTSHVFSSLTSNYWHNALIINNKTNKTGATVVFNSTTRQSSNLTMDLQP